jgi:hypothetical protein
MRRGAIHALLVLTTFVTMPASAQQCEQGLQEFQAVLDVFVGDLYELSDAAISVGHLTAEDLRGGVLAFDDATAVATPEELAELCEVFEQTPTLVAAPRMLIDAIEADFGDPKSGLCDPITLAILRGVAFVAESAMIGGGTACDIAGCWNQLEGVACTIACVAKGVLEFVAALANYLVGEFSDYCASADSNLLVDVDSSIDSRLDISVSSRSTQVSVDNLQTSVDLVHGTTVSNQSGIGNLALVLGSPQTDVSTELSLIRTDLSDQGTDRTEFQELSLRLSIEEILQPGHTGRISVFQLPRSVGGKLELVREIVSETISMNLAAGENIYDALVFFGRGDQSFNMQQYKQAFGFYRQAYQEAVRAGHEPDVGK